MRFSETAGTGRGTVVLSWTSAEHRSYALYATSNLLHGFTILESDLAATPPLNVYTDLLNRAGTRCYKVNLQP